MLLELYEKISYFWQLPGQWLGLPMSTAGGTGLIPGQGTKKKLQAGQHGQRATLKKQN